jgi:hypothetical protein
MGWVRQFKAGWNAPAGSWRRRPYRGPLPTDTPDEQASCDYRTTDELAKRDLAISELIQELEQCRAELDDVRGKLATAEADRGNYEVELANGATPALCRRFLKAALVVLHEDLYRSVKSIDNPAAFVKARYNEIEDAVTKIAEEVQFTTVT